MIYLKDFEIVHDSWVDYYFSPTAFSDTLCDLPENMPVCHTGTGFTSWYPWQTFYQRGLTKLNFEDITIFYGGNGSGKTTLLNVIAQKLSLSRISLYNRSSFFDDYISICKYSLSEYLDKQAIQRGVIISSDDVFKCLLETREQNQEIDGKRNFLREEYYNHLNTSSVDRNNRYAQGDRERYIKKNTSCSKYIAARLQKNREELSNGETAFNYFVNSIPDNSLVLLDEPENSLSAEWQMQLIIFLSGAIKAFNCQLIISTHSPFLLSLPGALIYDLDTNPIDKNRWYKLKNVRCYYDFFMERRNLFEG